MAVTLLMPKKFWILLLIAAAFTNLWPLGLYYLNDDLLHIPLTETGAFFQTNSVRPVHELLVKLDLLVWGKNALGFHITALLLHAMVCIQLFYLCKTIQQRWLGINEPQALPVAYLSVVLFLIYPQNIEGIAWILGRTPVLSAVFFLGSVQLAFVKKFRWHTYLLGALLFAATLFTYEQSILWPAMVLALVWYTKEQHLRKGRLLYGLALIATVIVYVLVRRHISQEVVGSYEGGHFKQGHWKILLQNAASLLLREWLNPSTVKIFVASAVVLVVLLVTLPLLRFKKLLQTYKLYIFFAAMNLALLIPVISLGITIRSFESSRYLYLPAIFLVMALALCIYRLALAGGRDKQLAQALLAVLCVYWLAGKGKAYYDYTDAGNYVRSIDHTIATQLQQQPADSIRIDTLHLTVHRLPVFRLGFRTGMLWLHPTLDTSKIVVKYQYDEFVEEP